MDYVVDITPEKIINQTDTGKPIKNSQALWQTNKALWQTNMPEEK